MRKMARREGSGHGGASIAGSPAGAARQPTATQSAPSAAALQQFPPDAEALFSVGARMQRTARMRGAPLSLLVLQLADLPEVDLVFGRNAAERVVDAVMTELAHLAASTGHALRTSPDTFALLLPDVVSEDLHRLLQLRLGKGCALDLDFDGGELLLVPDVIVRTVPHSESVRKAFAVLCRVMAAERTLASRTSSRRRHRSEIPTVPLPPDRLAGATAAKAREYIVFPATIPMPIAA